MKHEIRVVINIQMICLVCFIVSDIFKNISNDALIDCFKNMWTRQELL